MDQLGCMLLLCEEKFDLSDGFAAAQEARKKHMQEKHGRTIFGGAKLPYEAPEMMITYSPEYKRDLAEYRPEAIIVWILALLALYGILGVLIWQALSG